MLGLKSAELVSTHKSPVVIPVQTGIEVLQEIQVPRYTGNDTDSVYLCSFCNSQENLT